MSEQKTVGVGDFLIWLLLCVVTFGIYPRKIRGGCDFRYRHKSLRVVQV